MMNHQIWGYTIFRHTHIYIYIHVVTEPWNHGNWIRGIIPFYGRKFQVSETSQFGQNICIILSIRYIQ